MRSAQAQIMDYLCMINPAVTARKLGQIGMMYDTAKKNLQNMAKKQIIEVVRIQRDGTKIYMQRPSIQNTRSKR
jgi:hypothetical protein